MTAVDAGVAAIGIADGVWHVDPRRSELGFAVKAMWGLSTVRGGFTAYAGSLTVRAPAATGELTIDAGSLDTGNARRDRHLRSPDFLDAEHHPRIRFGVTAITARERGLTIDGQLRIATASVALRFPVEIEHRSADAVLIHGTASISRAAAGVAWNALGTIRDETSLRARLMLTRAVP